MSNNEYPTTPDEVWSYELATSIADMPFGGWQWRLSPQKPIVPDGSVRYLTRFVPEADAQLHAQAMAELGRLGYRSEGGLLFAPDAPPAQPAAEKPAELSDAMQALDTISRQHGKLLICCGCPTEGLPGDGDLQPPDGPTCCQQPEGDVNALLEVIRAALATSANSQAALLSLLDQALAARARQAEQPAGDMVPMPKSEAMAVAMQMLGHAWLQANAPHRLKAEQPAGNWVNADDVDRLVRELDVALNGEAAAPQAKLCDIVAEVQRTRRQPLTPEWAYELIGRHASNRLVNDLLQINEARDGREVCPDVVEFMAAIMGAMVAEPAPIDMVLYCPKCGVQHVDAPEGEDLGRHARHEEDAPAPSWNNPPHRSHLCHSCGHIWRPADVATNGVRAVKTKGKADSPVLGAVRGIQFDERLGGAVSIAAPAAAATDERLAYLEKRTDDLSTRLAEVELRTTPLSMLRARVPVQGAAKEGGAA